MRRVSDYAGNRRLAELLGDALTGQHQRGGAVADRRARRRGDRSVLGESGSKLRDLLGIALAGLLVAIDRHIALACRDGDRDDLLVELASRDRFVCAPEALDRELVLL